MEPFNVGKYVVIDKIGQGGMGEVYLANDPIMARRVAIKLLSKERLNKPGQFERFQREAAALIQLEHRAIVPLYDYGGLGGDNTDEIPQPYLVMRHMPGGSVSDLLKKDQPLELFDALDIVDRIGKALDYAHQKGYVHRDIKPSNFLLDDESVAYLADFGIAKLTETTEDARTAITQGDAAIGSFAYMSPEQITAGEINGRTDIYGLGASLYELLAGRPPFRGDSYQLMYSHLEKDVPSIHQFNNSLPFEFDYILQRALAKDPAERYPTADQFVKELKAVSTASQIDLDMLNRVREAARQSDTKSEEEAHFSEPVMATQAEQNLSPDTVQSWTRFWPIILGAVAATVLLFLIFGRQEAPAEPTPDPFILAAAQTGTPTATLSPTGTATTVATQRPYSVNLRINGDTDTAFWRRAGADQIESLPRTGSLALQVDEPVMVQVNANALLFNLPNGDSLVSAPLTNITFLLENEDDELTVAMSEGTVVLNSFGQTAFALDGIVDLSFDGRVGVVRENGRSPIEFHCLEGSCVVEPEQDDPVTLSAGSSAAVTHGGQIGRSGAANYAQFQAIIDSVVGMLPTETPSPSATPSASPTATPTAAREGVGPFQSELGVSAEGTSIEVVQFGDGPNVVIFVGGIHAGYAPNSVEVVEEAIDYFSDNPGEIPENVTLYFIPNLSPDSEGGVGTVAGRLNGNGVDLNRNWDCRWTENATVLSQDVPGGGGTAVFSEPETQALKALIDETDPEAVIVWGAGRRTIGIVLPGVCTGSSQVSAPLSVYYGVGARYDYSETLDVSSNPNLTGDLTNYLDQLNIPAAFVLLSSFTELDFERELAGIQSVIQGVSDGKIVEATPTPAACEDFELSQWEESIINIIIRPIGCAESGIVSPQGAIQQFSRGWMIWRQDLETVYVLYNDGRALEVHEISDPAQRGFEQSELLKGAFGYLHTSNSEISSRLGSPLKAEESIADFRVQDFDNGVIFSLSNFDGITGVLNTAVSQWRTQ